MLISINVNTTTLPFISTSTVVYLRCNEGHIPGTQKPGQGGSAKDVVDGQSKRTNYVQTPCIKTFGGAILIIAFFLFQIIPPFNFFHHGDTEAQRKDSLCFFAAHDFEPGLTRFLGLPGFTKRFLALNRGNHG